MYSIFLFKPHAVSQPFFSIIDSDLKRKMLYHNCMGEERTTMTVGCIVQAVVLTISLVLPIERAFAWDEHET